MVDKPPFYLKQWRKHRGMTQARLAEVTGLATGYVAELESRKRRYNEDVLEILASALKCAPVDLLIRDPTASDPFWSIWEGVPESQRPQALEVLKTFRKTETNG